MNDRLDQVISRRSFLRQGACASLGLGGLASQLFMTRMVNAALADNSFGDYRALVCVFLFGGNDNGNTLIPYDGGDQNFSYYQFTRGNLAIPQGSLASTIIAPTNTGGRRFALNPSMTDMKALFDSGNLAVLTNVGTLVEPTTKAAMQADDVQLPRQLFAHNWQQEQWQFSTADAIEKVGWGGRVADILQSANVNPGAAVSMGISIAGANVFLTGQQVVPYAVSPWGVRTLTTWGLGNGTEQGIARQAYADLLALQGNPSYAGRHLMQKAYADITDQELSALRHYIRQRARIALENSGAGGGAPRPK